MRKFSRSIQRRRAALLGENRVVSAEEASDRQAEINRSAEAQLAAIEKRREQVARLRASLDEEAKTLEHAAASIEAQSRSLADPCAD